MTRIIATVSTVAALLLAPAPALVASPSTFDLDLGGLPIVGPIIDGLLGADDPADPAPADPPPADPGDPAAPTDPGSPDPGTPAPPAQTDPTAPGAGATGGAGSTPPAASAPPAPTATATAPTASAPAVTASTPVLTSPVRGVTVRPSTVAPTPSAPAASDDPLLAPVDGTTLVFSPSRTAGVEATAERTPPAEVDGGLLLLIGIAGVVLVALLASRAWMRFRPE